MIPGNTACTVLPGEIKSGCVFPSASEAMSEDYLEWDSGYEVFYHAAPAVAVAVGSFQRGINPRSNGWGQFGPGFYTFMDRSWAERWGRLKSQSGSPPE